MTHQLAAISEQRGWNHHHHTSHKVIVEYLAKEYGTDGLNTDFELAETHHINFYHNRRTSEDIRRALDQTGEFVDALETIRQSPARPYTIRNERQQSIVRRLTGKSYPLETTQAPFMNEKRLERMRRLWNTHPPDVRDEGPDATTPARQPPPTDGGGPSAVAKPAPALARNQNEGTGVPPVERPRPVVTTPKATVTLLESPKFDDPVDIRNMKPAGRKPYKQSGRRAGRIRSNPRLPSGHRDRR